LTEYKKFRLSPSLQFNKKRKLDFNKIYPCDFSVMYWAHDESF